MPAVTLIKRPGQVFAGQDAVFEWQVLPEGALARYMLEPLDSRMRPATSNSRVTYPLLPEGRYTFRIVAIDENGAVSEEVAYSFFVVPEDRAGGREAFAPVTRPVLARRRGVALSSDYNKFVSDVHYDLNALAGAQAALRHRLGDAIAVWREELACAQARLSELEATLASEIDRAVADIYRPGEPHTVCVFPSALRPGVPDALKPVYGNCAEASIDVLRGAVTLADATPPADRLAYRHPLTGEILAAGNTTFHLDPVGPGITDNNPLYAVDHDQTTAWVRTVRRPAGWSASEAVTFAVELPRGLSNNPEINTVMLDPFPAGTVDVVNVEYRQARLPLDDDSEWVPLPGYPTRIDQISGEEVPAAIEGAMPTVWSFPNVPASALRITLSTRAGRPGPDGVTYTFGLSSLAALRRTYIQAPCYAHAILPSPLALLPYSTYAILEAKPVLANESVLSSEGRTSCVGLEFYLKQPDGTYAALSNLGSLLGQDEVLIVVALRPDPVTGASPALSRIDIVCSRTS